jgi:DNA-binding response OmpR family regulator
MSNTIQLNAAPKKVLVVARSLQGIAHWIVSLHEAGCWVELASTPAEAMIRAAALNPEVIVIDDATADLDSVELSMKIRSLVSRDLPPTIIMAVANAQADPSSVESPSGPLAIGERTSRWSAAKVNRIADVVSQPPTPPGTTTTDRLSCHGIELDRAQHRAWNEDRPLRLTPTEFKLLWTLASRPGDVLPRTDLTKLCRGSTGAIQTRTVDAHIKSIRRKLQDNATWIETVHGVGYRFQELDPR